MAQRSRLTTGLSGVAGEYFVAAELSRRGYIASLTLKNTRGVDILASNVNATRSVGIQVKTNQGSDRAWLLNQKIETDVATNLFFVFVRLSDLGEPKYHIVSRDVVSRTVAENHKRWIASPGLRGQQRRETPMRKFRDSDDTYLDRWDLLGLDLSQ